MRCALDHPRSEGETQPPALFGVVGHAAGAIRIGDAP